MVVRIVKKVDSKEVVKPKLPPLTLRQAKVVSLVGGDGGKTKADILRKAGYSKKVIDNPNRVFDSPVVSSSVEKVLEELRAHRDEVLERMREIYGKAGYSSLSITLANLNKDIELLSGRPTERTAYELSDEEKDRLRKLAKINKK